MLYGAGPRPSPTVDRLTEGVLADAYEASKNKLWVDEIYGVVFVKSFKVVANGLYEIVDKFVIDTVAVNGAAFVVGLLGRVSRWFQNGQIQRYLVGLIVGAAAVFFVTDCHRKPSFDYELLPDGQIHLHALPGSGLVGETAKLEWDLDGDGQPDQRYAACDVTINGKITTKQPTEVPQGNCATECTRAAQGVTCTSKPVFVFVSDKDIIRRAGDIGGEVTLWVEDPIKGETEKVTRTIVLPNQVEKDVKP